MSKKYNLIVPLAGRGQRMLDGGYELPKPMLVCGDRSILEWSMQSIDYSECNVVFVVREEHVKNFSIDTWLQSKFGNVMVVKINKPTSGAAETAMAGIDGLDGSLPLIIYCPDTTFQPRFLPHEYNADGLILTFKANSPNYSYIHLNDKRQIDFTREKEVVSDNASVGVYCFKSTNQFMNLASEYIEIAKKNNIEAHICPLYNSLIANNGVIAHEQVDKIHIMGTPAEFKFFEEVSFKYYGKREFVLCSDHSGYDLKGRVADFLSKRNVSFVDMGCYSLRDCDYNPYVDRAVNYIRKNKNAFGIGMCRSGQGINICANKYEGIRACLVQDEYHARYGIKHNAGNFFSLSANDVNAQGGYVDDILHTLILETFDGGRHQGRLMKNGS